MKTRLLPVHRRICRAYTPNPGEASLGRRWHQPSPTLEATVTRVPCLARCACRSIGRHSQVENHSLLARGKQLAGSAGSLPSPQVLAAPPRLLFTLLGIPRGTGRAFLGQNQGGKGPLGQVETWMREESHKLFKGLPGKFMCSEELQVLTQPLQ